MLRGILRLLIILCLLLLVGCEALGLNWSVGVDASLSEWWASRPTTVDIGPSIHVEEDCAE